MSYGPLLKCAEIKSIVGERRQQIPRVIRPWVTSRRIQHHIHRPRYRQREIPRPIGRRIGQGINPHS